MGGMVSCSSDATSSMLVGNLWENKTMPAGVPELSSASWRAQPGSLHCSRKVPRHILGGCFPQGCGRRRGMRAPHPCPASPPGAEGGLPSVILPNPLICINTDRY